MNKNEFIKKLDSALEQKEFTGKQIDEILEDYEMMIDEAVERGEDELTFIERLGSPKAIASALKKELPRVPSKDNKWIAISPFVALIIFFLLGFTQNAWHPAWLIFLIIPVTAITLETKGFEKYIALSPFFALVGFMLLGTYYGLWHPMWALFLYIAGLGFLSSKSMILKGFGVYTLVAATLFMIIVLVFNPVWYYHYMLVLPIPVMGIFASEFKFDFGDDSKSNLRQTLITLILGLLLLVVYILIGLEYGVWHPTWLMFLLIPVVAMLYSVIFKKERFPLVAFMPFISVTLFFLIGEYLNGYHYAWLAFLLIPMVAILFGDND